MAFSAQCLITTSMINAGGLSRINDLNQLKKHPKPIYPLFKAYGANSHPKKMVQI